MESQLRSVLDDTFFTSTNTSIKLNGYQCLVLSHSFYKFLINKKDEMFSKSKNIFNIICKLICY